MVKEEALTELARWEEPEKAPSHVRGLAHLGVHEAQEARHSPRDSA